LPPLKRRGAVVFSNDERDHEMSLINIDDYAAAAGRVLAPGAWDYAAGGATDEVTVRENGEAFSRWRIVPRVMREVLPLSLGTMVLGTRISMPVLLGPVSSLRLFHPEAELGQFRAAARHDTIAVCSMDAHFDLEEVAHAGDGGKWFQLYCYGDRSQMCDVIARVEAAGYSALVLTVDAFYPGRRERMLRSRFSLPSDIRMGNLRGPGFEAALQRPDGSIRRFALSWRDLEWIRSVTNLPIVLKGILHPDDAKIGIEEGASGIIVSNHGGRQLDQVVTPLDCLPAVVDAVAGRAEVMIDGGVRRGTDVIKALALGARAVLLGRAYVWGLAVAGEAGVSDVLQIFREEIEGAMMQMGLPDIRAIDRSWITFRED